MPVVLPTAPRDQSATTFRAQAAPLLEGAGGSCLEPRGRCASPTDGDKLKPRRGSRSRGERAENLQSCLPYRRDGAWRGSASVDVPAARPRVDINSIELVAPAGFEPASRS